MQRSLSWVALAALAALCGLPAHLPPGIQYSAAVAAESSVWDDAAASLSPPADSAALDEMLRDSSGQRQHWTSVPTLVVLTSVMDYHAGESSDLLIRNPPLGAALAQCLGGARVVLMRGHGCTVVAESVRVAVYRAIYTELNARLQLQASMLGEVQALTAGEADATQATNEGQVERPWSLWRERARAAH